MGKYFFCLSVLFLLAYILTGTPDQKYFRKVMKGNDDGCIFFFYISTHFFSPAEFSCKTQLMVLEAMAVSLFLP